MLVDDGGGARGHDLGDRRQLDVDRVHRTIRGPVGLHHRRRRRRHIEGPRCLDRTVGRARRFGFNLQCRVDVQVARGCRRSRSLHVRRFVGDRRRGRGRCHDRGRHRFAHRLGGRPGGGCRVVRAAELCQECFERGRGREEVALAEEVLEFLLRIGRGVEAVLRIELERAHQPGPQSGRQRLEAAARRVRPRRRDDVAEAIGGFFVEQPPAENQRQRHDRNLSDIGALIEARLRRRTRHRDAQVAPVSVGRIFQLGNGRSQHVLDHDDARGRRDDDALRRDRAVGNLGRVLVQHRDRRHQLAQQAQGGVDVECHLGALGVREHLREAHARRGLGDEREGGLGVLEPLDAPDPRVAGVPERRQVADPLPQRELERRHRRQLAAQAEDLDRFVLGPVGDVMTVTETVLKRHRRSAAADACAGSMTGSDAQTVPLDNSWIAPFSNVVCRRLRFGRECGNSVVTLLHGGRRGSRGVRSQISKSGCTFFRRRTVRSVIFATAHAAAGLRDRRTAARYNWRDAL